MHPKKTISTALYAENILLVPKKTRNSLCHNDVDFAKVDYQQLQHSLFAMQHLLRVEGATTLFRQMQTYTTTKNPSTVRGHVDVDVGFCHGITSDGCKTK
jgi:hypothetical protein